MIAPAELDLIIRRIVAGYSPDVVGLFGSHAIGTTTERSDLDLVVIKRTTEPAHRRSARVRQLVPMMRKLDVVVFTPEELAEARRHPHTFHNTVARQLKVIYVRGGFDPVSVGL